MFYRGKSENAPLDNVLLNFDCLWIKKKKNERYKTMWHFVQSSMGFPSETKRSGGEGKWDWVSSWERRLTEPEPFQE